jgi:FkbM family methyltransferase
MYSQNQEELFIVNYFSERQQQGKFLDIGGFNPFKFSNTRKLYEMGWSGIYIEPSPICFQSFVNEYSSEPKITLINKAVVTDDRQKIPFFESGGDAVSTSNQEHMEKWKASGSNYKLIEVETISTKQIEKEFTDIDFLSLDVESANLEIFNSLSNEYLKNIKCICVEHDGYYLEMSRRLAELGFTIIHANAENIILVK